MVIAKCMLLHFFRSTADERVAWSEPFVNGLHVETRSKIKHF